MNQFIIRCYRKLDYLHLMDWMPDKMYLSLKFRMMMGKKLNLKNPQTFNEKLQWLKLYDRKPIYTTMVDKYEAKKYVAGIIGEEYIIPTLGVWNNFDEINFDLLPDQFVLKCTHDSGGLVICRDKSKLDLQATKEKINRSLNTNYYLSGREWPYKNVKPRIIAEKYMVDESGYELKDYKFFCSDGFAKAMFIASDRQVEGEETKFDFFDMNFNHLPFTNGHSNAAHEIRRPESFEKMKELAGKLSEGIPQVRVDFYDINGQIYFGELTLSHWSGMVPFKPEEWDYKFGEWIKLPENVRGGGYLVAGKGWILYFHYADVKDEALMENKGLTDYKFYCFDGEPKFLYISSGLENHETAAISFLTLDWEFAPFGRSDYKLFVKLPDKPTQLEAMLSAARRLSAGHPFLRTDFYQIDEQVYFSELTFSPCGGFMHFQLKEWDRKLGDYINLTELSRC